MNKKYFFSSLISLLPMVAFAQGEGGGVHGGGHIVDVNGTPELIELVKGTTCEWKTGDEVLADAPQTLATLNKVAQLDWYFANAIEREIRSLNFCFTGRLFRLTPVDPQSPVATTVQLGNRYTQAALRLDSTVFVDADEFEALPQSRKSTLLIHEAMHSFIPMKLESRIRYLYLWTIVKDISLIPNRINTREKLHREMLLNQVSFPTTVSSLDRYRPQVEFLFASAEKQQQAVRGSSSSDTLIQNVNDFVSYLSHEDRTALLSFTAKQRLVGSIEAVLVQGSDEEFKRLIARNESLVKPIDVAIQAVNRLSDAKKNILFGSHKYSQAVSANLAALNQLGVRQGATRIQASVELARLLGANVAEETPLTAIPLKIQPNFEMNVISQFLVAAIQQGRWNEVQSLFTQNPEFYSAFGLKNQIAQVSSMNPVIAREKPLALEFLDEAKTRLMNILLEEISIHVTRDEFQKFKSLLK